MLTFARCRAFLRGVGIEPTQIALKDLKTFALTTRPSSLAHKCAVLSGTGFEPVRN